MNMNGHATSHPHPSHAHRSLTPHGYTAGRSSNLFQPPQSPALSSSTDYFSTTRSKKRSRPDSIDWTARIPTSTTTPAQSWIQCPTPSDGVYGSACGGSAGRVNERYLLRDGLDTPGIMAGSLEYEREHELGGRGKMRDGISGAHVPPEGRMLSGPLARERNGVARTRSSPAMQTGSQQGWTSFAFGLVGKMFSFGSGMIRGFYAGGGQGYDMQRTPTPTRAYTRPRYSRSSTPVPGAWQDDDFLGDFDQDNFDSPAKSASRPPNKRRQTDRDTWVMVGAPDLTDSSPKRKASSSSIPRSSNLAPRPSASRASSRRSLAPVSRRPSSYTTSTGSPSLASQGRPKLPSETPRRASFAPMRSTNSRPSSSHENYVSPEAERFARRQAKQDRAADKAMSSMSRQLQDLIRQGQEALGTKYAVESGDGGNGDAGMDVEMDEGYVDEEEGWR